MINVEVCIDNIESLFTAQNAGANRIELCSSLALGGLTPSVGLITQVMKYTKIPVYTMIRPRDGDFLYSSDEIEMMLAEIHAVQKLGVQGVVFGLLNEQAQIESDALQTLMNASKGLGVTFHRAIDCCVDAELAIDTILSAGCERVLTSGLMSTAELGADYIKAMVEQSSGRLSIMAGAGISANNVAGIVRMSGVQEVHLSGKVSRSSQMKIIENCGYLPEFMKINVTGGDKIEAVKQALQDF
ncbi:copper homeostasis protein CutC [Psychromonas sp. Urea-02u-13]|uniref:copper homeostasis protein CutC n=1 Tax=Psychromonas sp. Urea-02u-13 TaxID=2058326 RepID=UPI000C333C69|nr:copper homeostasis protein CutC [Psychromonas sp. Urea-02u-13]PKG37581.1 copper homeostasis protein CutC [Psychromonas sp. Urea-02u-13]